MDNRLVVASANPGKVKEIKAILGLLDLEIISADELGIHLDVKETGSSYIENAMIKARAYQAVSGQVVLADDSGLEVETLDGAPGIFSARYASIPNATDADGEAISWRNCRGNLNPGRRISIARPFWHHLQENSIPAKDAVTGSSSRKNGGLMVSVTTRSFSSLKRMQPWRNYLLKERTRSVTEHGHSRH